MICEVCHKNEANVHITQIINGDKRELNVCENCAQNIQGVNIASDIDFISPFSFQNILSGIMDYIGGSSQSTKCEELVCKNCGTTYSEFKDKGLFGCSECYKYFNSMLLPIINRVQGNVEHNGKIPKKAGRKIINKNNILKLKAELQKAVLEEEYEKAAELRDKIKSLQEKDGGEK
ncbi:protein arginine kinase activator [Clostridium acetobutylicum]|uniref:Uncharacterized conserved protein, containing ClpE-like Zn-zinger domain YACH B.subtilis ortholog n=1 Tax=Clostridium acetobutylicum (strain ATCC 824 / DSM 792 / JCM 1419 / IAM 19013 / LMG 5710 / NBRC 13948 / NRRL B-527 / VKM B-1787 / 2291 / W) TaxID=272562 RepID=Q97EC2_CLOAB|nr:MULTISPECIES: UvrB/UvrC motif-containing protein [Clostridium]AAK81128.1 Uncharacterized conserved protein, containing ClpE-like Zn-zinger domain; YACH B.subtilis ortholog [Clostridium acetobutylicum ATCC 824]ADZ22232.1 Conserved hypothetical protein [Clostridium acetobutylicum EA 2018]AEI32705.1 hypothetical protein SMB_G3227 [Clostridium acetobutylicum DSM 1731]AWV82104.1 excinuclease [Clostridium acetobutylicum]AWV82153.1 excinuclease [Clostridium acetobutylicum]